MSSASQGILSVFAYCGRSLSRLHFTRWFCCLYKSWLTGYFLSFCTLNMLFHCFLAINTYLHCYSLVYVVIFPLLLSAFSFSLWLSTIWLWYISRCRSFCLSFLGFSDPHILPFWKWSVRPLSFRQCLSQFTLESFFSPGWCSSVDWVPACKPKGHQFYSWSGHMPGLQARSPVEGVWEATTHWCISLSFSFPSPLSKNK